MPVLEMKGHGYWTDLLRSRCQTARSLIDNAERIGDPLARFTALRAACNLVQDELGHLRDEVGQHMYEEPGNRCKERIDLLTELLQSVALSPLEQLAANWEAQAKAMGKLLAVVLSAAAGGAVGFWLGWVW
jgi:hypothetical protein